MKKHFIAALFMGVLMLALTGCAGQSNEKTQQFMDKKIDFKAEQLDLGLKEGEYVDLIATTDYKMVFHTNTMNEENSTDKQKLYIYVRNEKEGERIKEIPFSYGETNNCLLLHLDKNEIITMLLKAKERDIYTLVQIDRYGTNIIEDELLANVADIITQTPMTELYTDKNGYVYFFGKDKVYCYETERKAITEVDSELVMFGITPNQDGEMLFAADYDKNNEVAMLTGDFSNYISGTLLPSIRLPETTGKIQKFFPCNLYEFGYYTSDAVYGYDKNAKKFYRVLEFEKTDLDGTKISSVRELAHHIYVCVNETSDGDKTSEVLLMTEK